MSEIREHATVPIEPSRARWSSAVPSEFDELATIYLVVEVDGTIRSANEAASDLLTRHLADPTADPTGPMTLRHLIHPDHVGQVEAILANLGRGDRPVELVTRLVAGPASDQASYFQLTLSRGRSSAEGSRSIVIQGWDITSLMRRIDDLEIHAHHDSLTGLANRSLFVDRLHHELVRSTRTGTKVAVMFADIDHFKAVNDTYGHETGDQVLIHVGRHLTGCLRPADTLARLGGDEFAVICPDITGQEQAMVIADRLRREAAEPLICRGAKVSVTLSVGVAFTTDDDRDDPEAALLRRADDAMYALKRLGHR